MISSFRLPDLVLGVSIRADVTGAKQAARDLKNAVGRELGTTGGTTGGRGGGGLGAGLLGGVLGAGMLGGGKGKSSGLPMALAGGPIGNLRSKITANARSIATTIGTATAGIYSASQIGRKPRNRISVPPGGMFDELGIQWSGFPKRGQRRLYPLFGKASRGILEKYGMKEAGQLNRLGVGNLATTTSGIGSTGSAGAYWASSLAAGAAGAGIGGKAAGVAGAAAGLGNRSKFSPRMFNRIGRLAGLGGLGGIGATMMMVVRFLGPLGFALIAAALAFKMAMSFVVSSLTTATDWIRKMGIHHGEFGNFSAQIDNFTVVWRNLKLEFGLMLIKVFDLGVLLQNITPIFVGVTNALKALAEVPLFQKFFDLALLGVPFGFLLDSGFWKGMNVLLGNKPTGNERIGRGTALNMAPAALEGSAEASRIVNQAVMAYQAETARNTKRCADTLQQILNRAPELGVVPG
jgi:hypothetical protein